MTVALSLALVFFAAGIAFGVMLFGSASSWQKGYILAVAIYTIAVAAHGLSF